MRHASNRYEAALEQIKADQAAGKMPNRLLVKGDFIKPLWYITACSFQYLSLKRFMQLRTASASTGEQHETA